jgi:hypothetical protein
LEIKSTAAEQAIMFANVLLIIVEHREVEGKGGRGDVRQHNVRWRQTFHRDLS